MRKGYTLIELLVVVVIMVILATLALVAAKRILDGDRPREAARQLNAHLARAKITATRNGRAAGIVFECEPPLGDTTGLRHCVKVHLAEVPPPWAGGTLDSTGKIQEQPVGSGSRFFVMTDPSDSSILQSLVPDGDGFSVRFNYRGDWYRCLRTGNRFTYVGPMMTQSFVIPPGYADANAPAKPFQVRRLPQRVGQPIELTSGTCIDVSYCGMGPNGRQLSAAQRRIVIMFSAGGGIDSCLVDNTELPPIGSFHFLVGRVDKVRDPAAWRWSIPEDSNLADADSLWVSVGSSGAVTTADNLPDEAATASLPVYLKRAREEAVNRRQTGG